MSSRRPMRASENALFCLKLVVGGVEVVIGGGWIGEKYQGEEWGV